MKKITGHHNLLRFTWKMAIETRAVELGFKNLGFRFLEIQKTQMPNLGV